MSTHQEQQQQEVFYNAQKGWQPHEDEMTEYKLESSFVTTANFVVENRLLRRSPRGGWDQVPEGEAAQLPAMQRGHVYRVRRALIDNQEFLSIKSMRFIDDEVIMYVLQGLHVLTPGGQPAEEPHLLHQKFLLPVNEEAIFQSRVAKIGGSLTKGKSSLESMYEKVQRLGEEFRSAKRSCEQTEKLVQQISNNVMSDAPLIDKHGEVITNAYRLTTRLLEQIREDNELIAAEPGNVADQGKALSYKAYAEKVYEQIEKIHRLQRSYEAQVAIQIGEVLSEKLPTVDMPEVSQKLLFAPLIEYYLSRGFNCTLTEKGMMIRVHDYVITLGDSVVVKHGREEAEQSGERQAHKRSVREL
jgi:hypothetical protein